jgi:very-short-patch-repair endonuclease
VLVGDVAAALRSVRAWAQSHDRSVVVAGARGERFIGRLANYLLAHDGVRRESCAVLERATGRTEQELLRQMVSGERTLLERHIGDQGDLASLALHILTSGTRSIPAWWAERADSGDIAILARLAPASALPCLLAPLGDDPDLGILREVVSISEAVPQVPISIVVAPQAWEIAKERLGASRYLALLQEGEIEVSPAKIAVCVAPSAGAAEIERAREARVTAQSVAVLRTAAETLVQAAESDGDLTTARSKVEAAFYELLQERPSTVGRFEMNGRLDVNHGPKPAEIDFLARDLGIAIELDGYHHFGHVDAYRRDRRKDVLLQKEGYLVLRFLADDVYAKLTEILGTIEDAVRWRQSVGGGPE